ncbi:MAG: alpha/beta hydrolase [Burkholderiales bacterium]|nr:MAG: alpha/beta hydrolase [Burkholderiales bacterium]TAG78647.1 MAG: alpha/beta hydrolase [Betaproteobacteria bacterium]
MLSSGQFQLRHVASFIVALAFAEGAIAQAAPAFPTGEIKGSATIHTDASRKALVENADVVLPSTAGSAFSGKFKDAPKTASTRVPVVLFLHGSSGLGLKAIGEWQTWLATLGIASVAPDSFALPDRVTYKSPIDKDMYERIHALRLSEIQPTLAAIKAQPWADTMRLVLAGTSEGAVPVARYGGTDFAARILFAWSCDNNYFVSEPRNSFEPSKPVLNVISVVDPFFSKANAWLGNAESSGHCGAALKDNANASVVLVPDAPHTLLNMPATRAATRGFLAQHLSLR